MSTTITVTLTDNQYRDLQSELERDDRRLMDLRTWDWPGIDALLGAIENEARIEHSDG